MDVLLAVIFASSTLAPCSFAITHPAPTSVPVRGDEVFTSRLRIIHQPDSPVVVTAVDFHDSELDVSPVSYLWKRRNITLELMNISDQTITNIRTWVRVNWASGGGGGHGNRLREPLAPGARAVLEIRGGSGRGTVPESSDLTVDVVIDSMNIGTCLFQPSQRIPAAP